MGAVFRARFLGGLMAPKAADTPRVKREAYPPPSKLCDTSGVSFSFLLFLAGVVARALALVGGRAFARVARKGTVENLHLECFLRRLHAKGLIGAEGQSFLDTMKRLTHAVAQIARFDGFCPVEKGDRPAPLRDLAGAVESLCAAPAQAPDSS